MFVLVYFITFTSVSRIAEGVAPQLEASVVLMPRSLLVFKDEAYTDCLHGIDAVR